MLCPIPKSQEFSQLKKIVGSEAHAYHVFEKNGFNYMDKAPNGNDSKLYSELKKMVGEAEAIRIKALTFSATFRQVAARFETDENQEFFLNDIKPLFFKDNTIQNKVKAVSYKKELIEFFRKYDERITRQAKMVSSTKGTVYAMVMSIYDPDFTAFEAVAGISSRKGDTVTFMLEDPLNISDKTTKNFSIKETLAEMKKKREEEIQRKKNLDSDDMPGFENKEKKDKFLDFIIYKEDKLNMLYDRLRKYEKEPLEQKKIMDEINKAEAELETYKSKITLEYVLRDGEAELMTAANMIAGLKVGTHEAEKALDYVQHVMHMIEFWTSYTTQNKILDPNNISLVKDVSSKIQERLEDLDKRAGSIRRSAIEIARNALLEVANKQLYMDVSAEELYGPVKDISWGGSEFRDISTAGIMLSNLMDSFKRKTAYRTRLQAEKIFKEVDEAYKDLSKEQIKKLVREDGNLRYRFSQKYYDEIADRRPKPEDSDKGEKWKRFFKWKRKNEIVFDVRKLFYEKFNDISTNETFNETDREAHILELKEQLGARGFKEYMDKVEQKINKYMALRGEIREGIFEKHEIEKGEVDEVAALMEFQDWELQNSPFFYSKLMSENVSMKSSDGKYVSPQGQKYTITVPRKYVGDQKTEWYDEGYEIIENDPKLLRAHEYTMRVLNDLYDNLPLNVRRDLHVNHLPEMKKSLIEALTDKDMKDMFEGTGDKIMQAFTEDDASERMYEVTDPHTKQKRLRLDPRQMVGNKLATAERSFDLPKVIKSYAMVNLAYKHKTKVEDAVRTSAMLFHRLEEAQMNAAGDQMKMKRHEQDWNTKGTLKNATAQFDYAVATFFNQVRGKHVGKEKILSKEEKRKREILDNELIQTQQLLEQKKITKSTYEQIEKDIELKLKNLGRHVNWTSVGDAILQFTQLKGMGWNLGAGIANAAFGVLSNSIEANRGQFFDRKAYRKATMIAMVPGKHRDKLMRLMLKFDVLKEFNEEAAKTIRENGKQKAFDMIKPYFIQQFSEQIAHGVTLGSTLFFRKITDLKGKERALWDAFKEDGSWNEAEFGKNENWEGDLENDNHHQELFKFTGFIDQLAKRLHGNYDSVSKVKMKHSLGGRALLQFRSWMAESITNRFESERKDYLLGTTVKGRYRSYGTHFKTDGWLKGTFVLAQNSLKQFYGGTMNFNEEMNEVDIANMKGNIAEINIAICLFALALVLKGAFGDDDDDNVKAITYFWLNNLNRLQTDLTFYTSPSALKALTKGTLIPAAGATLEDGFTMMDALHHYLIGEDEIKTGVYHGQSRLTRASMKMFPGFAAGMRFYSSTQTLYNK